MFPPSLNASFPGVPGKTARAVSGTATATMPTNAATNSMDRTRVRSSTAFTKRTSPGGRDLSIPQPRTAPVKPWFRRNARAGMCRTHTRGEAPEMDDGRRMQSEGKWDQMRGRVKQSWGVLTDDEIDQTEGKWDRLVGLIKEKTGDTAESIESRLGSMMD